MQSNLRILFIGDIIGKPGRRVIKALLPEIKRKYDIHFTIANGENLAGGLGITKSTAEEVLKYGIDCLTTGNHVWDKKEAYELLNNSPNILRPLNYPPGVPGKGICTAKFKDIPITVANIQGRVFMPLTDCPFRKIEETLKRIPENQIVIVDFHAEATSEKIAMGWFLDGRVSALIGTHTHVATADEKVLPKGTAYITDAGMTGPTESVIGIRKDIIIERFLTSLPAKFEVANKELTLNGVIIEIDTKSGKAIWIKRVKEVYKDES